MSSDNQKLTWFYLFLASFLSLFFELLYIRWIPALVHVVGFFTNLVLIASFMGMGIGVAVGKSSKSPAERFGYRLIILNLFLLPFLLIRIKAIVPGNEHNLNEIAEVLPPMINTHLVFILPVVYALVLFTFIPIGELVGYHLARLAPIQAYSLNIVGSLVGVIFFSLLSYLGTSPGIWFLCGLLGLVPFMKNKRLFTLVSLIMVLLIFGAYSIEEKISHWKNVWTPYYNLKVVTDLGDSQQGGASGGGFTAMVNSNYLLSGIPVSKDQSLPLFHIYSLPYHYCQPKTVLVLGSGGGQDIAMALFQGARTIDAVEIDPVIVRLGQRYNPDKPYAHSNVSTHVKDARTFLSSSTKKYDLIVFGTLDSHGLFSAMTSLKMENFVYTREAFEEVKGLLTDRGVVALTVGFDQPWVSLRLFEMMSQVFGGTTISHAGVSSLVTILAGPGMKDMAPFNDPFMKPIPRQHIEEGLRVLPEARHIPSDDWPHLFLRKKQIPIAYIIICSVLIIISLGPVYRTFRKGFRFSSHFFFLGAGFMLLETESITQLALVYGSTWITNSVVIAVILLVILFANLLVLLKRSGKKSWSYVALLASLAFIFIVPLRSFMMDSTMGQFLISFLLTGTPIFFAALIFAHSFAKSGDVNAAFSSNLMGSVVGGFTEYLGMMLGLHYLYIVAILFYLLSLIGLRGQKS